jgi:hypothetical protein
MNDFCKFLVFILIIFSYQFFHCQEIPKVKDTAKVFRKIEKFSKKRKFTTFIHKLIFEPISENIIKRSSSQKIVTIDYSKYEGKIIRKIKIITLDPFGYSDKDSLQKPNRFLYKAGNFLHLKSKKFAISNLLLIKKNKPLDSLLVKESMRLVRSQRFVSSITSYLDIVSQDSLDVTIRVMDSWSLVPDFNSSTSKSNFRLSENNFLGFGHRFQNSYTKSLKTSQESYSTSYSIPTILNTFINSEISYDIDLDGSFSKAIYIERPFFSTYTRWASGVNLGQKLEKKYVFDANFKESIEQSRHNFQDYWAGHSFQIFKGNSEYNRSTNFITTLRYFNKNYLEKPNITTENFNFYSNEKLYLLSLGITSRKFTQDKYIFNFNVVEDVASGFVYSFTSGFQQKNSETKYYTGGKIGLGNYFSFGYLSGEAQYGTFVKDKKSSQTTASLQLIYFTNLIESGRWKFRQFVNPQYVFGNNRLDSNSDRLTLNGTNGILGFDGQNLFGTQKVVLNFQTQGYSPWRLFGFRLNPYFSYSSGLLGQKDSYFKRSKLYSEIGLGAILSNDYLIFNSFQFSFSYFPSIPGNDNSIFKTNSIRSYDFGLQNFEISKPDIVEYK